MTPNEDGAAGCEYHDSSRGHTGGGSDVALEVSWLLGPNLDDVDILARLALPAKRYGRCLSLCRPSPELALLLEFAGLDGVFEHPTDRRHRAPPTAGPTVLCAGNRASGQERPGQAARPGGVGHGTTDRRNRELDRTLRALPGTSLSPVEPIRTGVITR